MADFDSLVDDNERAAAQNYGAPIQQGAQQVGMAVEHVPQAIGNAYNSMMAPTPVAPTPHQWTQQEADLQAQAMAQAPQQLAIAEQKNAAEGASRDADQAHQNAVEDEQMTGYTDVPKPQYADGGDVSFDSLQDDGQRAQPAAMQSNGQDAAPGFDDLQDDSEKYGTAGQMVKTGLEGVAKGVAGPLAPYLEHKILKVPKADILAREKENPISSGIGQGVGLVGGAMTGVGEGALMEHAGTAMASGLGLGAVDSASLGYRVGSSAVKQATEMAILQGSDETAKMILNDPETSAQSAIANIGLAAALGGGAGAFITGAVSPLWKATAGLKVEELLNLTKNALNGGSRLEVAPLVDQAAKTLGIDLEPAVRAGIADDVKANTLFSTLRRSEHPELLASLDKVQNDMSNSVMNSLGTTVEAVTHYDEAQAGRELADKFQNEVRQKYDPAKAAMEARDAEASPLRVPDEARLDHAGKIQELGINEFGTDSEYYKQYQHYSERLLAKDTIGDIDKLKTEVFGKIKAAERSGDSNMVKALGDIRNSLSQFQEQQIEQSAVNADKAALANSKVPGQPRINVGLTPEAGVAAQELLARRQAQNQVYAKYAGTMDDLMSHLGMGDFRGTKGLLSKVTEKLSPEELMRKFTIKGNSDLIPFLQQHLPDTYQAVVENERKRLIKPAILAAGKKGENPVDINRLHKILQDNLAGKKEYVQAVLPKEAIDKIEAAKAISSRIPSPRDSGTPAGLAKILAHMPASALAGISWATGHGPVGGYMAGEMAKRLGKDAPDGIKMAYLKFLGSDQPVSAGGFKAMVEFAHNTAKGENMLAKGSAAVLKGGSQVLADKLMPSKADNDKLDKLVTKIQKDPNEMMKLTNGETGHYMPTHQAALSATVTRQMNYLAQLKPKPFQPSPLDKPIEPSTAAMARYNRALSIANQPLVVLQHIKNGTLQPSDVQDLQTMAPGVAAKIGQHLSNAMINAQADGTPIPYRTKMGLSLFLAQPMDASMTPQSIMSAQPKPQPPMQNQEAPMKGRKGKAAIDKLSNSYKTSSQGAESDRSDRE